MPPVGYTFVARILVASVWMAPCYENKGAVSYDFMMLKRTGWGSSNLPGAVARM